MFFEAYFNCISSFIAIFSYIRPFSTSIIEVFFDFILR